MHSIPLPVLHHLTVKYMATTILRKIVHVLYQRTWQLWYLEGISPDALCCAHNCRSATNTHVTISPSCTTSIIHDSTYKSTTHPWQNAAAVNILVILLFVFWTSHCMLLTIHCWQYVPHTKYSTVHMIKLTITSNVQHTVPVSYTHLTLPTKRIV